MGWGDGAYSIARFELSGQDNETRLAFEHTGFPEDEEEHLAAGWHTNYWEPMQKYLAK
jgi:activator of HSP90 ATPase